MNEKTGLDGKWAYVGTLVQGGFKIKIKENAQVTVSDIEGRYSNYNGVFRILLI